MSTDPDNVSDAAARPIEYGVQWTSSPSRQTTVASNRRSSAAEAEILAQRMRALQRVFGNVDDAIPVYRIDGGEWYPLLPQLDDTLIREVLTWLRAHDRPDPFIS